MFQGYIKKILIVITAAASLLVAPFGAGAVNDITINGIVSFTLNTLQAVPTAIIAGSVGPAQQVTGLDVQSSYIDITLDNLSDITFHTTVGGQFLKLTPASGANFTVAPACPTTMARIQGIGATVTVRVEVTSVDSCLSPGGGGGGSTPIFPTNYSLAINSGASVTTTPNVTLNLAAENTAWYMVSNDLNFIGATWQPFLQSPTDTPWTLTSGDEVKTVYALFKSSDGNLSNVINAAIELKTGVIVPPVTPPVTPPPSSGTGTAGGCAPLNYGDLFKGSADTVYYYASDGQRYDFPNRNTYNTWYADFKLVKHVADTELAKVMLGGNVTYKPGVRMIKLDTDPKVYAVDSHAVLRWVTTAEVAADLYGSNWSSKIDDLSDAFFVDYRIGDPINNANDFDPAQRAVLATSINVDLNLGAAASSSVTGNQIFTVDCVPFNYGDLLKGSADTVYYYASDGQRYDFPNRNTYNTWYADFKLVKHVADTELAKVMLGGNVTYRPGVRMIKLDTDPKVYAVDSHAVLRWVTTAEVAAELYGSNWSSKIDDLSDAFFVDYRIGDPINNANDFDPAQRAALATSINVDLNLGAAPVVTAPSAPVTKQPEVNCQKTMTFTSFLEVGDNSPEVKALQKLLQCLSYFSADVEANGNFGPSTEAAVKEFQSANGIEAKGYVGPGTRAALNKYLLAAPVVTAPSAPVTKQPEVNNPACQKTMTFTSFLEVGDNSPEVKALQKLLQCLSYFSADVEANGNFGPSTEAAVKKFQSANGIEAKGYVGPGTRAALNKY